MSDIVKDINSIWTRLFDQRAYLNGEIQFTLREFEQKRSDKEIENLFAALLTVSDIKDIQIDRIRQVCNDILPQAEDNLIEALNLCGSLHEIAAKYKQDTTLQKYNQARKEVYETFMDDMCVKCKEIDIRFAQKEEELQQFYTDLETKLNLTRNST